MRSGGTRTGENARRTTGFGSGEGRAVSTRESVERGLPPNDIRNALPPFEQARELGSGEGTAEQIGESAMWWRTGGAAGIDAELRSTVDWNESTRAPVVWEATRGQRELTGAERECERKKGGEISVKDIL